MPTPRSIEIDPEAGALYVRFSEESASRTVEKGEDYVVDYAADGSVVGVEFLDPTPTSLRRAAEEFGFIETLDQIGGPAPTAKAGSCTVRSGLGVVDISSPGRSQSRPSVPVRELTIA
jgi:uncharacterized protein YuzE